MSSNKNSLAAKEAQPRKVQVWKKGQKQLLTTRTDIRVWPKYNNQEDTE